MIDTKTVSLKELMQYTSDYHKDAYGYRPTFNSMRDPEDLRGDCINLIDQIDEFLDRMQETDAGRDALQTNNWML